MDAEGRMTTLIALPNIPMKEKSGDPWRLLPSEGSTPKILSSDLL